MPRHQLQGAPGLLRRLLAISGPLLPGAGLDVMRRGLLRRVRFQRFAQRDETLRRGGRIALRHQPRMQRDRRRIAGIFRQRVREQLLALQRIAEQERGAELEVPALAGLDAAFRSLPQNLR